LDTTYFITNHANHYIGIQQQDGSFPSDRNGPWNESVTPARITSHISILLSHAFKITNNNEYYEKSIRSFNYLKSSTLRPQSKLFKCRNTKVKNQTNGLVGQAWVCEALIEGYELYGDEELIDIANTVVLSHTLNKNNGLWHNSTLAGERAEINRTANQQIFFTAIAEKLSLLTNDPMLRDSCCHFWRLLPDNLSFSKDLLQHKVNHKKHLLSNPGLFVRGLMDTKNWHNQSLGYLPFVLYGLSLAYKFSSNSQHWNTDPYKLLISNILSYIDINFPYHCKEDPGSFNWSYNPTGIEVALAVNTFNATHTQHSASEWFDLQISNYCDANGLMNKFCVDPIILCGRSYEATRLQFNHDS